MHFRQDINALRALAVILVILFHFRVPGFAGGFVGVDVFFVISGFLMTGIITTALERNDFSFVEFYHARARRIFPALAFLCVALLFFGYFYLPVEEYRGLIREVKSGLLFYSNFDLAAAGGYFDTPPAERWLLHTWSLSVEWQFYFLYPVLLYAIYKFYGRQRLFLGVMIFGAISYGWSIYLTPQSASSAFYMLPSRAFELLAGAAVYLRPLELRQGSRQLALAAGGALILACGLLMDERLLWPGYLALLPVVGTVLVLLASSDSRLFGLPPIRYLGAISYSAYLWHWPVVVVLYFCGLLSSALWVVLGIAFSLAAADLSYRFVEGRFRRARNPGWSLARYCAASVVLVAASAAVASAVKKYPEYRPAVLAQGQPKYSSDMYTQVCSENDYGAADCELGDGDVTVILYGDSHAQSTATAVQVNNKGSALSWALGGCPLLLDFSMRDKELQGKCQQYNREKLDILAASYIDIPVVIFNYYSIYLDAGRGSKSYVSGVAGADGSSLHERYARQFESAVCRIAENHPVYLVKPIPDMPFSVYKGMVLQERLFNTGRDFTVPLESYLHANADAREMIDRVASNCNAKIIDPVPVLCPDGHCLGTLNNNPLYFDDNHLVDAGNLMLKDLFRQVFGKPEMVVRSVAEPAGN